MDTLETLCADALTRLPSHDDLVAVGKRLFTAVTTDSDFRVSYLDESKGRMGDSLAERSATLRCGRYRMCIGADWLDRRDSDGAEITDVTAPRGLVDLRVRIIDELREAQLRKNFRRKRPADYGAEVKFVMCHASTADEAVVKIVEVARVYGWNLAAPRLEVVSLVA